MSQIQVSPYSPRFFAQLTARISDEDSVMAIHTDGHNRNIQDTTLTEVVKIRTKMKTGQHMFADKKGRHQPTSQIPAMAIAKSITRPPPSTTTTQCSSTESEKRKEKEKTGKNDIDVEIPVDRPGIRPRPSQMLRLHHRMAAGTNPSMRECRQEKPSFFLTFSLLDDVIARNVNASDAERKGVDSDVESGTDDDMPTLLDRDPSSSEDDMPPLTNRYSYSTDEEFYK